MPEKTVKRRLQDCDAALDIVRRRRTVPESEV